MRRTWIGLSACLVCMQAANPLRAGVYNTAEPDESPRGVLVGPAGAKAIPFDRFRRDVLSDLIGIGNPKPESPKRRHYLARRDELQAKARTGRLSTEEQSNLGAYLIRLRQYEDAVRDAAHVAGQDQEIYRTDERPQVRSETEGAGFDPGVRLIALPDFDMRVAEIQCSYHCL